MAPIAAQGKPSVNHICTLGVKSGLHLKPGFQNERAFGRLECFRLQVRWDRSQFFFVQGPSEKGPAGIGGGGTGRRGHARGRSKRGCHRSLGGGVLKRVVVIGGRDDCIPYLEEEEAKGLAMLL